MPRNRRLINIRHQGAFDALRRQSSTIGAMHRNNDAQPIVSRVQIEQQESQFHVRAYFPDESAYIRGSFFLGQSLYYKYEGMLQGETEYSIKLETNNARLFLFFIRELIRVSPGVAESGVIETLETNGFLLDNAYPSAQDIPNSVAAERLIPVDDWVKIGDWNRILTSSNGPMRHVEFSNPLTQSPLIAVFISEYRNGDIRIVLDIHTNQYIAFKNLLTAQGLSSHVKFDLRLSQISLTAHYSDSPFLSSFLLKAQQVDASIGLVLDQMTGLINQTVSTYATRAPIITETQNSSVSMNIDAAPASLRTNEYMSRIENILREDRHRIIDGHTGSRRSGLFSRNARTDRIEHANIVYRGARNGLIGSSTDRPLPIAQTIHSVHSTRSLENVSENDSEMQNAQNQSFAEHYGHTAATYRPSQSPAPAMPDNGANAKALDGMDIEIPEHLCCAISLQIMTDPVTFAGITNQDCYEYSWIMHHLHRSKTHPFTREAVSEKMLVSILPIKRECDKFTKEQVEPNSKLKFK